MGWMVLLLLGQAACAAIGLRVLVRRVLPASSRAGRGSCIYADVWAPLAIVAPLIVMAGRAGPNVKLVGWLPLGAPACVGLAALGAALWSAARSPGPEGNAIGAGRRLLASMAGAGLLLVLLGGADELTVWTGQCSFAVAAVLLWMNTPAVGGTVPDGQNLGGAVALLLSLLCAGGQCVACLLVSGPWIAASAAIATVYAIGVVAGGALTAGPGPALRVGGWAAALGTLLGIGGISLVHLMPQSFRVAGGLQQTVDSRVAFGFGAFAFEGMLLLLLPAGVLALPRLGAVGLRRAGLGILLLAAGLAIWRIIRIFEEVPQP